MTLLNNEINKTDFGNAIELNAIAFSFTEDGLFSSLVEAFNKYSQTNNLDIKLELNLMTPSNSSTEMSNSQSIMESLLSKGSQKYEIYFYDNIYNYKFGRYMIDLNNYLPKEHIDLYASGIASEICYINNTKLDIHKLTSLPIKTSYTILYSNMELLKKYNKTIPKTWDELIETSEFIIEKENKTNLNLFPINGLLTDTETGTCSLYDFIYSCRNSTDSPFPPVTSDEFLHAIEKFKEMKDRIGSDDLFQKGAGFSIQAMYQKSALFIKYWNINMIPIYKMTNIPGLKEGISGTTIGGQNIGVAKFVSKERIEASVKVIKYLTSYDVRKNLTIKTGEYSAIPSLYDDPDVCKAVDCEFMKGFQFVQREFPSDKSYDDFSKEFRSKIYEYIFGNKTALQVTHELDRMNKFYYITFTNSLHGKLYGTFIFIILGILIASLALPFIPSLTIYYKCLPPVLWIISIFGTFLMFGLCFIEYGPVTPSKCQLRILLYSFGLSLNLLPIICQQVKRLHMVYPLWKRIQKNIYIILFSLLLINNVLYMFELLSPFLILKKVSKDFGNTKQCVSRTNLNKFINAIILIYEGLILMIVIILSIIGRKIEVMKIDSKFILISLYSTILSLIMIVILSTTNIDNYDARFIMMESLNIIFSISNHIIFFIVRPISLFLILKFSKDNSDIDIRLYTTSSTMTQSKKVNPSTNYINIARSNYSSDDMISIAISKSSSNENTHSKGLSNTSSKDYMIGKSLTLKTHSKDNIPSYILSTASSKDNIPNFILSNASSKENISSFKRQNI